MGETKIEVGEERETGLGGRRRDERERERPVGLCRERGQKTSSLLHVCRSSLFCSAVDSKQHLQLRKFLKVKAEIIPSCTSLLL